VTDQPDDILERAAKAGGEALADAYGWHADRGDYMTARTVIISARPVIEAPLRAEITRLEDWKRRRSNDTYGVLLDAADALLAENKRLRAALELIADVGPHGSVPLCRHTAAKALAQAKESA